MDFERTDNEVILSPDETGIRGTIIAADDIGSAQSMAEFLREDMASGSEDELV